jgi:TRAP-type uncharacterized transport system substrate-binding protein
MPLYNQDMDILVIESPCPWPTHPDPREQHTIEHLLEHVLHNQSRSAHQSQERDKKIMADFTALTAAITELGASATADHDAILAAFGDLGTQLTDLKAQIDALVAGQLDQATIDAMTETVTAADAAFDDAAAAVTPVVTPPVEPAP